MEANQQHQEKDEDKALRLMSRYYKEILEILNSELGKEEISRVGLKNFVESRIGNPSSKFRRGNYEYRKGGEDALTPVESIPFFLEFFNNSNAKERCELKYELFNLFKESGFTPSPYRFKGLPRVLLLSNMGDLMLEDKLKDANVEERKRLYLEGGELLLKFHIFAQEILPNLMSNQKVVNRINDRAKRSAIIKAIECLKTYKSEDQDSLIEQFSKFYSPIAQIYDDNKRQIIHGDAGAQNIIGPKNGEWYHKNMSLIDLEDVRWGDAMFDLAMLATTNNMNLNQYEWIEGIENYIFRSVKRDIQDEIPGFWGKKKIEFKLTAETKEKSMSLFYAAVIHESLKRIGYMNRLKKDYPQKYDVALHERPCLRSGDEEMGRNIKKALDYIIDKNDSFAWQHEDIQKLVELRTFFINEGIIPDKLNNRKTNNSNGTDYQQIAK